MASYFQISLSQETEWVGATVTTDAPRSGPVDASIHAVADALQADLEARTGSTQTTRSVTFVTDVVSTEDVPRV